MICQTDNQEIKKPFKKWYKCPRCGSKQTYHRLRTQTEICRSCGQIFRADMIKQKTIPLQHEPL